MDKERKLLRFPREQAPKEPVKVNGEGRSPLIRVLQGRTELRDERGSRTNVGGEVTYSVNREDSPRSRELTVRKLARRAKLAKSDFTGLDLRARCGVWEKSY
ncbi:MAG: hypothetical protein KatS3mg087_1590 [Patescibacteria group bacterium]|nr:MAG: hypothetical protein KatS3mg087_1590 [Patescibacteria group bacterium]